VWRLKTSTAPQTDRVVNIVLPYPNSKYASDRGYDEKSYLIMIANSKSYSEEFHDVIFTPMKILPLPTIYIVGEGLTVGLERFHLPGNPHGEHRISEDFVIPLSQVGEPSEILCEECIRHYYMNTYLCSSSCIRSRSGRFASI
jgi:hypothetical protein